MEIKETPSVYKKAMRAWINWCDDNNFTKSVVGDIAKMNKAEKIAKLIKVDTKRKRLIIKLPNGQQTAVQF
jgi:hypothetical protein